MKTILSIFENLSFYVHCSNLAQLGKYEQVKEMIQGRITT